MSLDTPSTATLDQPIVVRNSKWKLLLMSLFFLLYVLPTLWIVITSPSSKNLYVGLLALTLFGPGLLISLLRLFSPSIVLTIDSEGIHSFYPFWHPLTMKWQEVNSISPIKSGRYFTRTTFNVSVSSKLELYYIARNFKSGKIPFTMRHAHSFGHDISIPLFTATLSYTKIIALIRLRYAEQVKQFRIRVWER